MIIRVVVWINDTYWQRTEHGDCNVDHDPSVIRLRVTRAVETLMSDISDTSIKKALKDDEEGGEE